MYVGQYTLPEAYKHCSLVPGLISSVRAWERAWVRGYECCVAVHELLNPVSLTSCASIPSGFSFRIIVNFYFTVFIVFALLVLVLRRGSRASLAPFPMVTPSHLAQPPSPSTSTLGGRHVRNVILHW